ncbi:MAG: DPP IV N-terminal domain-containing protein [Melioribacteraceae bacterium]|nr:DPP IV N-terminal domain-containing protein [Melioribacteraceae bacterium]
MKKFSHLGLIIIIIFFICSSVFQAQNKKLTFQQVFRYNGPRLTSRIFSIDKWLDDKNYLQEKTHGDSKSVSLVKVNAATGDEEILIDYQEVNKNLPEGFNISGNIDKTDDLNTYLFSKGNELFYYSLKDNQFKRIADYSKIKMNPTLSPDGKYAAYTSAGDLYVIDIENNTEKRITNDASDVVYNGFASWVYYEEILGRRSRYKAFWWSPAGDKLCFLRFDDTNVPLYMLYKADGVHGEWEKARYPKSGDPLPYIKFGIVDIGSGNVTWADFDEKADHMIAWPFWYNDGSKLIVQWMNRGMDNIKLYEINPDDGSKKEIYDEKQNSWVEWLEDLYLLKDNSGMIIRSDKNGFEHLYHYSLTGELIARLTSGNWNVKKIVLVDEKNDAIYFQGNEGESTENHLFKVSLSGDKPVRITKENGTHNCNVSAGGSFIIDEFSNITTPNILLLLNSEGKRLRVLDDSKTPVMDEYNLGKTELFRVKVKDGYELPVQWTLPPDFNESKKYPIIFSIYGGPSSASVSNSWSRFLSQFYYAQEGIIFAKMDNRGSGHFGKKGEAELHRNLGRVEIDDFIEVAKWAENLPFIDSGKIGITGGSYGGYASLMCITRGADVFDYALAELSVTDWHLYDNVYTERYMDKPEENPDGYKSGSVMNHADKYNGYMLITHGTMDDNVHPQNSIQLIDKLQDLDKDFEMMFYPNGRHGWGPPKRYHSTRETVQFWFKHLLSRNLNINND